MKKAEDEVLGENNMMNYYASSLNSLQNGVEYPYAQRPQTSQYEISPQNVELKTQKRSSFV